MNRLIVARAAEASGSYLSDPIAYTLTSWLTAISDAVIKDNGTNWEAVA